MSPRWSACMRVILAFSCSSIVLRAEPLIEIRSGRSAVIAPGSLFSATLALPAALIESDALLRDRLILPIGWSALSPLDLPFVAGAENQIRLIAVPVPITAAAGEYRITYVLASDDDPGRELARSELLITVPAISALRIETENAPERLIAGDKIRATWRLTNRSNHPINVQLRARSSLKLSTALTPSALQLVPGESALVSAEASSPAGLRSEQAHDLLLESRFSTDTGGSESVQTASARTRLLPRFTSLTESPDELRLFLKTTAARRRAGSQEYAGFQTELSGGGFLDAERTRRLDLLLRSGQFGDDRRILGREHYSVHYRSPSLDLLLGDNTFNLSPLTQRWQWGRGAAAEYRHASLATGAYFLESRYTPAESRWHAWFLQYDPAQSLRLRSNLLVQERPTLSPFSDTRSVLPSVQVILQPNRPNSLELEAAASDNRHVSDGRAWRARLKGREGTAVYYDFEYIDASPDYLGYYHDLRLTSGTLSWQPSPAWLAQGSFLETRHNPDRDPRKSSASTSRTASAGLDRRISPRFTTALHYTFTELNDPFQTDRPGYKRHAAVVSATTTHPRITLRGSVQAGQTRLARPGAEPESFEYASLLAFARPSPKHMYSLYVGTGDSRYDPRRREVMATGAAQWSFFNAFHLRTALSTTRYRDDRTRDQTSAEVSAAYTFRGGSSIEGNMRVSSFDGRQQERTLFLSYTVPLPVPRLHGRDVASLAGEIKLETPDGPQPLAGVVLRLGKLQAATDRHGRFVFPAGKPGRHEITVDPTSLGLNIVLAHPGPFFVELARNQRTQFDLFATRGSRVEGELVRYEISPDSLTPRAFASDATAPAPLEYRRAAPLARVRVELRRNGEKPRHTYTDERGRFTFDRLPPGEWILTCDESSLPEGHHLEQREQRLALTAGTTTHLPLRLFPVHRPLQMLDSQWLTPPPHLRTASHTTSAP